MEANVEQHYYPRTRNPRACEACRTSKSRCFASEQPNICQKCLKSRLPCFVRATARPGRAKKRNIVIQEPNSQDQDNSGCDEESEDFYMKLETVPFADRDECLGDLEQRHQEVFDLLHSPTSQDDPTAPTVTSVQLSQAQKTSEARMDHVTKQQILTLDQADRLLQSFFQRTSFFPFIVLPKDATVKSLSRTSPFLLLAALTAASATDIQLNHQLDHQFKRVLGEKVILEGCKSLDFLQGLLVYNAWYPLHLKPRSKQSIFMYLSLAISLAEDLGLGHRHQSFSNIRSENVYNDGLYAENGFSRAAKRAYLGCYYLSSSWSIAFQRQKALEYSDLIEEYGCSLAKDPEIWSDSCLLPLVRSCGIQERIVTASSQYQSGSIFQRSTFAVDMETQAFYDEIEDWKRCLGEELKSLPLMVLTERFLMISVFCEDLTSLRPNLNHTVQQYSSLKLSKCLEATKRYFETLLSIQAIQYRGFTTIQWGQMIHAILALSRLSSPILRCPNWDIHAAREYAPLGMFLDCLCYRMQALSAAATAFPTSKNPDGPFIFRMLLESFKKSYERHIAAMPPRSTLDLQDARSLTSSETAIDGPPERLRCPMANQDFMTFFESIQSDLSPASNSSIPEKRIIYHDLWATMTMSWSAD